MLAGVDVQLRVRVDELAHHVTESTQHLDEQLHQVSLTVKKLEKKMDDERESIDTKLNQLLALMSGARATDVGNEERMSQRGLVSSRDLADMILGNEKTTLDKRYSSPRFAEEELQGTERWPAGGGDGIGKRVREGDHIMHLRAGRETGLAGVCAEARTPRS
jgi:hypothetical protein